MGAPILPGSAALYQRNDLRSRGKGISEAEMPWPEARRLAEGENVSLRLTPEGGPLRFRDADRRRHRRRGLPRLAPLRLPARRGATASSASTTSRRARSRTSSTSAATTSCSCNHDITEHLEIDEPVDFVYHLAALASPIDYLRLPLHTLKVGSYGTHNALGLAKFKRARFLLASTSEVYGDPQVHPQPETYWGNVNPIGPRGVYDEAKRYAEALTMAYHRQQGVDTAIVRIFNTYGPRMRPHDGRAIPTFVRQALANEPLTVFGDGSQTRSFCYVDDLIRGLVPARRERRAPAGQHRQPGASSRCSSSRRR